MQGEPDTRVRQLQNRLASLGFNVKSDGRFGPATEQAVRAFQTRHGLQADGVVGDATKASLRGAQPLSTQNAAAANAPAAGAGQGQGQGQGQASGGQAYGSKYAGDSAAARQARGNQNEQIVGQRDIGTKTKAQKAAASARKRARRTGGSQASGAPVIDTGAVIDGGSVAGTRSRAHTTDTIGLGLGMDRQRGDKRVAGLQQMLDDIGMNLGAGGTDGKFGPDTRRALLRFQRKYGLKADGIFGKKTRTALNTVQKLMNARDRKSPGSSLSEHLANDRAVIAAMLEADTKHDYPGGDSKGEGMKRCPSCGWRNAKGKTKCSKCGAQLAKKGDAKLSEAPLTAQGRKQIDAGNFVFPEDRRYPIHDIEHARNALARSSGKPEEAKVRAAVYAKYPQLKKNISEAFDDAKHPRDFHGRWKAKVAGLNAGETLKLPGGTTVKKLPAGQGTNYRDQTSFDVRGSEPRQWIEAANVDAALHHAAAYERKKGTARGKAAKLAEAVAARQEAERVGGDIVGTRAVERMLRSELGEAGTKPEPFSRSKTSNWVARAGGLPTYIQHVAHDIKESDPSKTESQVIAIAISQAKKNAAKGNAQAAAAVAQWERMKAKAKVSEAELAEALEQIERGADPNPVAG